MTIDGEEIVTFEYAKTDSNKWGNEPQHWSFVVVPGITIDEAKTIELKLTHTAPPGKGESTALAYLALVSPPNVEIDEEFLLEIEQVLGIEGILQGLEPAAVVFGVCRSRLLGNHGQSVHDSRFAQKRWEMRSIQNGNLVAFPDTCRHSMCSVF